MFENRRGTARPQKEVRTPAIGRTALRKRKCRRISDGGAAGRNPAALRPLRYFTQAPIAGVPSRESPVWSKPVISGPICGSKPCPSTDRSA